jgi:aminoglycoside phosphotransferase (APT) family kinase protein
MADNHDSPALPHIDVDLVRRLIREQFPQWAGLAIVPVEPQGWDNRTFRIGCDLLARLPSDYAYASQVDKEQSWLPRIAPHLPVAIPKPIATGTRAVGYPWSWSIYRWIDGEPANDARIDDLTRFARELAAFLKALHEVDTTNGPIAGEHSFFRGGSLTAYDAETREAIDRLDDPTERSSAENLWNAAVAIEWQSAPVWVHGDVAPGNLLVNQGRLSAVIDFGCLAVGDPACDLAIAWTFFEGESRDEFRRALDLDEAAWTRGKAWALWKALILSTVLVDGPLQDRSNAKEYLRRVLEDI